LVSEYSVNRPHQLTDEKIFDNLNCVFQTPAILEQSDKPESTPLPSAPTEDIRNIPSVSDLQFPIGDTWRLGNPHFSSDSEDDSESTGVNGKKSRIINL